MRAEGRELINLTNSNPTACGFEVDADAILRPLSDPAALLYDPDPRGIRSARQAVSGYYAAHHAQVNPDHLVLTTSTSEAYSFLLRLLCNPGDELLVAQPSYPLFDYLAAISDVQLQPYPLFYDFGWWIDFAELERRLTPRTRAILLVHPNNPTGHATSLAERQHLEALCERHGLALIVDEVFLDYGLGNPIQSSATGAHPCLTFVVSGISKIAALPQMKVGWLLALGPQELRDQALARLEVISDTFLSMNAPAQHALPHWLGERHRIQNQILTRVRENVAYIASSSLVSAIPIEAGWSAVLQIPQSLGSETLAEQLVHEAGVIVHPGSFYALPGSHRLIVSLLEPSADFNAGITRLTRWCESKRLTLAEFPSS